MASLTTNTPQKKWTVILSLQPAAMLYNALPETQLQAGTDDVTVLQCSNATSYHYMRYTKRLCAIARGQQPAT